MKNWKIFFTSVILVTGCAQQSAEVVHKKGGIYSPTYTENYIESPDGKMVRSLRSNRNSDKAQKINIINDNAIERSMSSNNLSGNTYVVESGDNLSSIARKYEISTKELAGLNDLEAPYSLRVGQRLKVSNSSSFNSNLTSSSDSVKLKNIEYVVKSGDNLSSIAREHNISTKELADLNDLEAPYSLRVGQKLKVSNSSSSGSNSVTSNNNVKLENIQYVVKSGDNLSSVARDYNMTTKQLAELNDLEAPYSLRVGQKIKVLSDEKPSVKEDKIITKTYVIKKGDSLLSIAKKNNTELIKLADLNGIKKPYSVKIGQKIKIVDEKATKDYRVKAEKAAKIAKQESRTNDIPEQKLVVKEQSEVETTVKTKKSNNSSNSFMWPVKGEIVSNFGNKSNGLYNDGINISAPKDTSFKASEDGVVAYVGNELRGYGTIILIKHNNNWISAYAHCAGVKVSRGDKVEKGQIIGTVGQTGNVNSPQLYFSLRNGREAVDPLKYLQ